MFTELIYFSQQKVKVIIDTLKSNNSIWRRNLLIIAFSQFLAMMGMGSVIPFLPLYIRELGVTNLAQAQIWSGLVFSGPYILSILAVPVWGALGDKYGRRMMVVRAIIGLGIAMALMGFAQNIWQLFFLRVFQGVVSGFIAASLSFVSANTPRVRSGFAMGFLQSAQSAGNILGPLFGGVLSDLIGIRPVFWVTALLCFICGVMVQFWVKEEKAGFNHQLELSVFKNFKFVMTQKELRLIILMIIISQAGIFFTMPIFPFFVESLHAPQKYLSTITGSLVGIIGVFSIIFAPAWGRRNDKKDYHKTITVATLIIGVALLLHAFATNYIMLFPLRIIIGIFIAAVIPTFYTVLSKKSSDDNVGGIMGIASSASLFGALISFLTCGYVSSFLGINACFIISGLLLLLITLISYFSNSKPSASSTSYI